MTQQPPTNLEQFVNKFNERREAAGKDPLLDRAVGFYQELVKHRTTESYFDAQQFTELHQQISGSLDEEGLSDEERTDIILLGISLSRLIEERSVRASNFDELSQAHRNFVADIATHPGVKHAQILNHAISCLDNDGVEPLAQKSVEKLGAANWGTIAFGIDLQTEKAKTFIRYLIAEQANANKKLRDTVQRGLSGNTNFATQQSFEAGGR